MKVKIKSVELVNACRCCHPPGFVGVIFDASKDDIVEMMKDHQVVLTTDQRLIKASQLCTCQSNTFHVTMER